MADETTDARAGAGRYGAAPPGVDETPPPSPGVAFADLGQHLQEAIAFAGYYLKTRLDLIRLAVRRVAILAVVGLLALLAGAAIVITAAVLVCMGIVDLIGTLTGHRWIGELVTGLVFLAAVGAAAYFMMARLMKTSRAATIANYKQRLAEQRSHYGTDVNERAHRN